MVVSLLGSGEADVRVVILHAFASYDRKRGGFFLFIYFIFKILQI